jgi:hypothetical protein
MRLFLYRLMGFGLPILLVSQLALPSYLGDRVEGRLTEDGGTADVSLSALPALRLLAGRGDKLYVRASGLRLEESRNERPFDRLDRFGDVTVYMENSRVGPFRVRSFFLDRDGDQRYRVLASVTTNLSELGSYAGERLGGPFGRGLAALAASALSTGGSDEIPAQLRATVDSSGDLPRTIDAYADVGGLPAGPLALILTDAMLASL